jgi:hypothetical protein
LKNVQNERNLESTSGMSQTTRILEPTNWRLKPKIDGKPGHSDKWPVTKMKNIGSLE